VVTLDETRPEAQALAITGHTITALGSDAEIQRYVGSGTEVVDLAGRLAVPGFIEGHGHFMGLGDARLIVDLTTARSWEEVVAKVAEAAARAEPGAWVRGRGWHQEKWSSLPEPAVDGVPVNDALDAVSPANPVLLVHASGHASLANDLALAEAGVDGSTPDPDGGTIVRDASGQATGLLRENAQGLARAALERSRADLPEDVLEMERRRRVEEAGLEALSKGVTSFQDAGSSFETIDFLKRLADSGELPIRLYVMVRGESNQAMRERLPEYRLEAEEVRGHMCSA
jgi:predicted amidohydrolase YtcJ